MHRGKLWDCNENYSMNKCLVMLGNQIALGTVRIK